MANDDTDDGGIISKIVSALVGLVMLGLGLWFMGSAIGILMLSPL